MSKETFFKETINPDAPAHMVEMWVGPRTRDEIERALMGNPTTVAVPTARNINDGTGPEYYRRKKGFKTMAEYDAWIKDQSPKAPSLECPYCDHEPFDSKIAVQAHVKECEGYKKQFPMAEAVEEAAAKIFECPVSGCTAAFDSEKALGMHVRMAHKKVGSNIKAK